jgi:hypothetical protein
LHLMRPSAGDWLLAKKMTCLQSLGLIESNPSMLVPVVNCNERECSSDQTFTEDGGKVVISLGFRCHGRPIGSVPVKVVRMKRLHLIGRPSIYQRQRPQQDRGHVGGNQLTNWHGLPLGRCGIGRIHFVDRATGSR